MPDLSLNLPERSAIGRPTKHAITGFTFSRAGR
jgi:hypothetical protein